MTKKEELKHIVDKQKDLLQGLRLNVERKQEELRQAEDIEQEEFRRLLRLEYQLNSL